MRKFISTFFKSKFNIVLFIVQVVACLFFILGSAWVGFVFFAIISEGVFFIILGIKTIVSNRQISQKESILAKLPIGQDEIDSMQKSNKRKMKSNKFTGFLYIVMGIILVFIGFF